MSEYKEVADTLDIPSHAGIEGFLLAIRQILRMPRVTSIVVDASGKISYTRYARPEEPRKNIEADFDSVAPNALVRNALIQELDSHDQKNAAICIAGMFNAAAADHMYPVGFVTGANSNLYAWHASTTGIRLDRENVYGLPVYPDRFIPDDALLLVTAYARGGSLVDVQKSYKLAMPSRVVPVILSPADLPPGASFSSLAVPPSEETLVAGSVPNDRDMKAYP